MKIDCHHHLINEPGYLEGLIGTMDRLGIDQVCLSGINLYGPTSLGDISPGNEEVLQAFSRFPDRIIPFLSMRLGRDRVSDVEKWLERGFRGAKTTRPLRSYDDPDFDPVYALLQERNIPVLFHTGLVLCSATDATDDVTSDRMRPVTLDRVARSFPNLTIIMAHLGVPWHAEAAMLLRMHPNVYADLTGAPGGWTDQRSPSFFQEIFYWKERPTKLVFGTDVHWRDMEWSMTNQSRILDILELEPRWAQMYWGDTARLWWNDL